VIAPGGCIAELAFRISCLVAVECGVEIIRFSEAGNGAEEDGGGSVREHLETTRQGSVLVEKDLNSHFLYDNLLNLESIKN